MKKLLLILMLVVRVMGAGRAHWIEKYPNVLNETLISNFTEDIGIGGWYKTTGSTGDTLHYDSTNTKNIGSRSLAFYSINNSFLARKVVSANYSTYDVFVLRFYFPAGYKEPVDTIAPSIVIGFGTDLSNQYTYNLNLRHIQSFNDWYTVYLPKKAFSAVGSPNWGNIIRVYITFYGRMVTTSYCTFDRLSAANTPLEKGGLYFNMDVTIKTNYHIARDIFTRYGFNATLFNSLATGDGAIDSTVVSKDNLKYLQNTLGWDVGSRGYVKEDRATNLTNTGLDTQYARIRYIQDSLGLRFNVNAYPYGAHNRRVDSVSSKYFDFCRATNTYLYQSGITNNQILMTPISDSRYGINSYYFNNHTLSDMISVVDSAIANRWVTGFLFHQFGEGSSGDRIDTTVLKQFLQYVRTKVDSGYLSTETGKLSNYLLYAPDSCITNKTRSSGAITDSISLLADSMKIILYDSTATGWDTLAISPMLKGGSLHTFTTSGWPSGLYRLREWGITNAGTVDSMLSAFDYTVLGVPLDTVKVGSFDYINSSGNMYPTSGWSIRIVRGTADTMNTTISAQNGYGFTGVTPESPLVARTAVYELLFINGTTVISRKMKLSKQGNNVLWGNIGTGVYIGL